MEYAGVTDQILNFPVSPEVGVVFTKFFGRTGFFSRAYRLSLLPPAVAANFNYTTIDKKQNLSGTLVHDGSMQFSYSNQLTPKTQVSLNAVSSLYPQQSEAQFVIQNAVNNSYAINLQGTTRKQVGISYIQNFSYVLSVFPQYLETSIGYMPENMMPGSPAQWTGAVTHFLKCTKEVGVNTTVMYPPALQVSAFKLYPNECAVAGAVKLAEKSFNVTAAGRYVTNFGAAMGRVSLEDIVLSLMTGIGFISVNISAGYSFLQKSPVFGISFEVSETVFQMIKSGELKR